MNSERDIEKLKYLFQTSPYEKGTIEKYYKIFGFDFIDRFFALVKELDIHIDLANEGLKLYVETFDLPENWYLKSEKPTYYFGFEDWMKKRYSNL